jgi:nicotinamidase-related amidase
MSRALLRQVQSVLVVTDVQTRFMEVIDQGERVRDRSLFLARIASLLQVPILGTQQNPERLGPIVSEFEPLLHEPPISKMSFSCTGEARFREALARTGRTQAVLVGVETHICVCLTANQLLEDGFEVVVCPDAVSSRSLERHKLGMERIRDAGAVPAHTESVAYDWLGSADHPQFREALAIVKQYA